MSLLGNATWATVTATVSVLLGHGAPSPPPPPPPPLTGFYSWQNAHNKLCLDVKGKLRSNGAIVDVWTCVDDYNEKFSYDAESGHIIEETTGAVSQ